MENKVSNCEINEDKEHIKYLISLVEEGYDGILNNGTNFDMSKITGCCDWTMDDCETNCKRYYSCDNILLVSDILVAYEMGL